MPQYKVGHQQRVGILKQKREHDFPGIIAAGSSYKGFGIPDCIDQGEAAVKKVLKYLNSRSILTV